MKTHPLLHPPLELTCKTPACPDCGLPVKWYDTGDDIIFHLCIDSKCPSNVRLDQQIEKRKEQRSLRLFFLCLSPILIPIWLLGGVVAIFYGLGLWGYNSLRLFDEIWNGEDDEDWVL